MLNQCIICNIINKNLKSYQIYEDELFIAFLDNKPLFMGHSLLVPKLHIQTIYDLPPNQGNIFLTAIQRLGNAITKALNVEGSFIAMNNIVSQSIPHLHVHIVPRNRGDGLKGFFWPRMKYNNEMQINEIQQKIINALK